ncbi:hypothetical protein LCGC14_3126900, partial [marine sediment metagenome]
LDLLLYLIRRDEIDIHDIPIAKITEQYCSHMEVIKQIDPDVAGEFLVLAATLMEIKTRLLLPHIEDGDEGDEGYNVVFGDGDDGDDGFEVELRHAPPEQFGGRVIALMVGMAALLVALLAYFVWVVK